MTRVLSLVLALTLTGALHVAPAQAQLARTFVSSATGNDANDCGRATPCKTFQRAHDTTLTLGEITVLDPGGYGAVTITKGISIINDGVGEAGVLVSGGLTGITINAGVNDHVSLRGLTVKGIGFGGGNGILFNGGKSLTIENCAIRNLTGSSGGIGIALLTQSPSSLTVSNTLVADNDAQGVYVLPFGSGAVNAIFNRVEAYNNGYGIVVDGGSAQAGSTLNVTVADSVAANNMFGFSGVTATGHAVTSVMVVRSVAANNNTGIVASGVFMQVGQSTVTGNAISWLNLHGANLQSFGDNYVVRNADGDPAMPVIAKK